jgi:hypothetical protein
MSICKWYFWVVGCVALTSTAAWGQVASSPFSQFGIGEAYSNALANSQGSVGLGVSQPQYWYINNQNPALLVYNAYASFQAGLLGERRTTSSAYASEKFKGGNLNYLVLAFPVKSRKWSTSLGLMPYSTMNYKVQTLENIEGSNSQVGVNKEGTGGLTQLYWSNGIRIYKDFSLGLKATYLFGSVNRISKFNQIPIVAVEDKYHMKDFIFSVGSSYSKDTLWGNSKNYRLSLGAVFELGSDVRTFLYNKNSNLSPLGDTLGSPSETRTNGYTHLPGSVTVGASFSKGFKWAIGAQYTYQDWSTYETIASTSTATLGKSWKASFGGEYIPDPDALEGVLKRSTYRIGISSERYPFLANGNAFDDLGINFGVSVPTARSSIDLGVKVGKRGNKTENLLEENYFKIYFGLTFNDVWFIKRRFD